MWHLAKMVQEIVLPPLGQLYYTGTFTSDEVDPDPPSPFNIALAIEAGSNDPCLLLTPADEIFEGDTDFHDFCFPP
jgi:hypothetical protein